MADATPARLRLRRQEPEEPLRPARAFEEHEEGHEDDRDRAEHDVDDALRDGERGSGEAEDPARAALVHLLAHLLDDVVLGLEEAEPAAAARQVVDVVGGLVDEGVHLVDERRDEQGSQPDDAERDAEVGDPDRGAAAVDAVALEPFDGRVQREREEERDEDPRQHVPRDPDDLEHGRNGEHDPDDGKDGPRRKVDDPLEHGASINGR